MALLFLSAGVVVAGGTSLARTGDQIAEHTGLGRVFVGSLFIAIATSLPELGTTITAAARDVPDLAIGDLFGSSMANMAILGIVDLRYRQRLMPTVELGHTRVAAVAIGMTALAVMAIATPSGLSIGAVGFVPMGLAVVYLAALAWFRRVPSLGTAVADPEPFRATPTAPMSPAPHATRIAGRFVGATAALLVATPLLTISTESLGDRFGISQGVLGITVLAIATSLPELSTSIAAVRLGAPDLAVGNLFGSNAANMAMILAVDVFYSPGPVLGAVDDSLVVAGTGAILLMSLAIASVASGRTNRAQRFEPDSAVLVVAYVAGIAAVAAATA